MATLLEKAAEIIKGVARPELAAELVLALARDSFRDEERAEAERAAARDRKQRQRDKARDIAVTPTVTKGGTIAGTKTGQAAIPDQGSFLLPGSPESSKPDQLNTQSDEPKALARRRADPNFSPALRSFCERWEAKYGEPYQPTPADLGQLKSLLTTTSRDIAVTLPDAFALYLADLSPFVAQDMRHSLKYFCTSGGVNKYRVAAPILSAKEARSIAAGEQWEAMHNGAKR